MSAIVIPPQNLIVEWRYPANINVYTQMDQLAVRTSDKFPHWQRTPLSLQLENRKFRRRFFMSHRRSFFDVVAPADHEASNESEFAIQIFNQFVDKTSIEKIERIGLRQWFAVKIDMDFASLVARSKSKFHPTSRALDEALQGEVEDVGYTADVSHVDGWKFSLKAGPMEKQQWFELVPHEPRLFDGATALLEYKDLFPTTFLFFDIDCYTADVSPSESFKFVRDAVSKTQTIVKDFKAYFLE